MTRSVLATAIIGGGYMLLIAVSGMFFGTFVDRHLGLGSDGSILFLEVSLPST